MRSVAMKHAFNSLTGHTICALRYMYIISFFETQFFKMVYWYTKGSGIHRINTAFLSGTSISLGD